MSEQTKHDRIFLQVCDDEGSELCGEVTWCQDRIHESDVKYIRKELHDQQLANATKQNVLLRGIVKRTQQACLFVDDDGGVGVASDVYVSIELFNDVCKALDATADLAGLVLCDAEPVAYRYELKAGEYAFAEKQYHSEQYSARKTTLYQAKEQP